MGGQAAGVEVGHGTCSGQREKSAVQRSNPREEQRVWGFWWTNTEFSMAGSLSAKLREWQGTKLEIVKWQITEDLWTACEEFGYFPKGSRKALSCFEPGEVNRDTHFGEPALACRCSVDWNWTTLEDTLGSSCSSRCWERAVTERMIVTTAETECFWKIGGGRQDFVSN